MVAGFVGFVGPKALTNLGVFSLPTVMNPLLIGFVASLITALVVSRQTQVSAEEIAYRESLHVAPPEMADEKAMRRTLMWPSIMMVWGAISSIILIVVYTRPYQLAAGIIAEDGPYVTWSGELLVALIFGATISASGFGARFILTRVDRKAA